MNEKLLTHKPTHRVALRDKGINSVMGLKKKGEHKLLNTICPFKSSFSHRNVMRLRHECFCVSREPAERRGSVRK